MAWLATRPSGAPSRGPAPEAVAGAAATAIAAGGTSPGAPPDPGPGEPAPSAAPEEGFRILVTAAGRPVAAADVRLYRRAAAGGDPWEATGSGHTGVDGSLLLAASPGAHLVAASAPGLARALVPVTRPAGESRTAVEVRLGPAATLVGRVVERRSGAPVPLATVVATPLRVGSRYRGVEPPPGERATTITDAHGAFRLEALPAGRVDVEARAVGHAPGHRRDVAVPSGGEVRLELASAAMLEGVVTRDGRPVPGAQVVVIGPGEPVILASGAAGGFAAEVEPGLHRVFARHGEESGSAGRTVPVAAGSTARGVEVRLGPGASVSGQVRSARGPIPGATVTVALHGDPRGAARATASSDGGYAVSGLAPGSYLVTAAAAGHADATFPSVNLRAGDRFRLDATLAPPAAVEGTVTDADGRPIAGALVSGDGGWMRGGAAGAALLGAGSPGAAARTDAGGRYRLEGVPPGPVWVSARRDLSSPSTVKGVTVEEGETASADLVLVEGGVISGRVLDAAGRPLPGAMVLALAGGGRPRPGELRQATADAGGAWLLALAPGTYDLGAIRAGGAPRFTGRPRPLATVTLVAGQVATQDLLLPDEAPPTVTGQVLEPGEAPAGRALVWVGTPGPGFQVTQADAEGAFSLAGAEGEPLQVSARNGGRTVSVSVTPPASGVVLLLQPGATLRGRLQGDPPPETFTVTTSTRAFTPGGGAPDQRFAGDTFEMEDVLPAALSLHVRTDDGRVGDAQVTVGAGEAREVRVALSPAATVTGRLVDASTGAPVTRARILVDGVASRRLGVTAAGTFTRVMSEGAHQLTVSALGYAPATLSVRARADAPVDLGDVPLTPSGSGPAGPSGRP